MQKKKISWSEKNHTCTHVTSAKSEGESLWCIKQERCLHSGTSVTAGKIKRVSLEASSVFHSQACTLFCMAVLSARVLNRASFITDSQTAVCLHCLLLDVRCNDIRHTLSLPHLARTDNFISMSNRMCGRRGIYYYIKSICNSSLRGILFGLG